MLRPARNPSTIWVRLMSSTTSGRGVGHPPSWLGPPSDQGGDMSIAEQVPSLDVLEKLAIDHRVVERLFDDLKAKAVGGGREGVLMNLVSALRTHVFVEEHVLYPAIRTAVAGGDELVDGAVEEHQALKTTLARLETLDPNDHEAEVLLAHLQRDFGDHMDQEEQLLFPMLRSAVDEGRLLDLAEVLERARKTAQGRKILTPQAEWASEQFSEWEKTSQRDDLGVGPCRHWRA